MASEHCLIFNAHITQEFKDKVSKIAWVGLASSSLTVLTTSAIIIFIFYKGIYSLQQVKPLLHLSIADFLLSFVWFSANLRYITNYDETHPKECFVWQMFAEIFHLATFGFTMNYSINVYLQMKDRSYKAFFGHPQQIDFDNIRRLRCMGKLKQSLYYLFWIIPLLLMLPIMVKIKGDHICMCERCVILIDVPRLVKIQSFYQIYGFGLLAVCLSFSIFVIVILYFFTLNLYWSTIPGYHTDKQRKQLRNMQKRITLYVVVFLICWTPALVIACIKTHEMIQNDQDLRQNDVIELFQWYILQTVLTPLQGFLNTIVYGWSRKSFRTASRPSNRDINTALHSDYLSETSEDPESRPNSTEPS